MIAIRQEGVMEADFGRSNIRERIERHEDIYHRE